MCEGSGRGGTYIGKASHSVFWLSNYLTVGYSDGTRPTERFSAQESLALFICLTLKTSTLRTMLQKLSKCEVKA